MIESYFEYCIMQCDDSDIASVCEIYKTKAEIFEEAKKGFNGYIRILGQGYLISAASDFMLDNGFVCYEYLGRDIRKLYDRFTRNIAKLKDDNNKRIDVDKEFLFNTLVDMNWLLPSLYKNFIECVVGPGERPSSGVELLSSTIIREQWWKRALREELYECAVMDKEYSEHYQEAQQLKYAFFPGLIPYPEVRRDVEQNGATSLDFERSAKYYRSESVHYMALYYGLTATAALERKIRRIGNDRLD